MSKQVVVRRKVRGRYWVEPETEAALRAYAAQQKMPISQVAEAFIRSGLGDAHAHRLEEMALPVIEAAVTRAMAAQGKHMEERLASLLVKMIREAGVGRRLSFATLSEVLVYVFRNDPDGPSKARAKANRYNDAAYTAAAEALRQRESEIITR